MRSETSGNRQNTVFKTQVCVSLQEQLLRLDWDHVVACFGAVHQTCSACAYAQYIYVPKIKSEYQFLEQPTMTSHLEISYHIGTDVWWMTDCWTVQRFSGLQRRKEGWWNGSTGWSYCGASEDIIYILLFFRLHFHFCCQLHRNSLKHQKNASNLHLKYPR